MTSDTTLEPARPPSEDGSGADQVRPSRWRAVLVAGLVVAVVVAVAFTAGNRSATVALTSAEGTDVAPEDPTHYVRQDAAAVEAAPSDDAPGDDAPIEPATPQPTAWDWSTDGADIVDAEGNEIRIRGVNWFGFETAVAAPHGLWSRNAEEMIDQIAGLGFNTIRLPFASALLDEGVMPEGINLAENPDLEGITSLELMDRIIEHAGSRGLAVLLDRHALAPDNRHHLWYDDTYPAERLISDWQLLAERYADVPNVIGADLYNEPHDEACWGCDDPARDWRAAA